MVTDHPLCEGTHILVLALVEGLLARFDVELVRRVGNMRDLRVCGLGGRRGDGAGGRQPRDTYGGCNGPVHGISFRVRAPADEIRVQDIGWRERWEGSRVVQKKSARF